MAPLSRSENRRYRRWVGVAVLDWLLCVRTLDGGGSLVDCGGAVDNGDMCRAGCRRMGISCQNHPIPKDVPIHSNRDRHGHGRLAPRPPAPARFRQALPPPRKTGESVKKVSAESCASPDNSFVLWDVATCQVVGAPFVGHR